MISIEVVITNDGAAAAKAEIRSFLALMDRKMAGDVPDRGDTAARGYVVLRGILQRIESAEKDVDLAERRAARRKEPTVREARR